MTATEHGTRSIDGIELTPKQVHLDLPTPFATVEEERLHRKQKLAGALRIFGRVGFGEGVAGHITVRDPEFPELFWVNPFAMSFRHIKVSDLILVDHDGNVVYGSRPVNRAAFVIHSAVHQARRRPRRGQGLLPREGRALQGRALPGRGWLPLLHLRHPPP